MIIEIDNHCPGRPLKCCEGCQRFGIGSWAPEIRKGRPDYCVHRVPSPEEIRKELEDSPL